MTNKTKYYEVRRYPDDPWDNNNLLWTCDTRDEAERRIKEFILRGMDKDNMFVIEVKIPQWKTSSAL